MGFLEKYPYLLYKLSTIIKIFEGIGFLSDCESFS